MHEILSVLSDESCVLDLGSARGSFHYAAYPSLKVVQVDLNPPAASRGTVLAASAAALPLRSSTIRAAVLNHSLEHFELLDQALSEVSRVVQSGGSLYVSVPDATTLTDRIYRWLTHGGGHVNLFTDPEELASLVSQTTGLRPRTRRTLYTSLSFLNRHNLEPPLPRRFLLFANGNEQFLKWFNWGLRALDRLLGTRLSVYGWAFYFGEGFADPDVESWKNVCVRCGSGHPLDRLTSNEGDFRRGILVTLYDCPDCGTENILFP